MKQNTRAQPKSRREESSDKMSKTYTFGQIDAVNIESFIFECIAVLHSRKRYRFPYSLALWMPKQSSASGGGGFYHFGFGIFILCIDSGGGRCSQRWQHNVEAPEWDEVTSEAPNRKEEEKKKWLSEIHVRIKENK